MGAVYPPSVSSLGFPDSGNTQAISVVETNYNEYALLLSTGTKGMGQPFRMTSLYSGYHTPPGLHPGETP